MMLRYLAAAAAAWSLTGCASIGDVFERRDETEQTGRDPTQDEGRPYDARIIGLPEDDEGALEDLIKASARVWRLKDRPPASTALLRRRAEGDISIIVRVLKSEGYYEGTAEVAVTEPDGADPEVAFTLAPGPQYRIESQEFTFDPAPDHDLAMAALEAAVAPKDAPAQGRTVVGGENAALTVLNTRGRPYARRADRDAVADFDTDRLRVRTNVATGPDVVYGVTQVDGAETVSPDYIAGFVEWREGDPASLAQIRAAQRELAASRLFDSVRVALPEDPPEQTGDAPVAAPVAIEVEEAKHRTIGGGLSWSTVNGPGGRAFWEHRNFWGEGERLRFNLSAALSGQSLGATFRKPRWRRSDQALNATARLYRKDNDAYGTLGFATGAGVERRLSDHLSASLGAALEVEQIDDGATREMSYLAGLPSALNYDVSNDLLNPTTGWRGQWTLAPWGGVYAGEGTVFLESDARASVYVPLDSNDRMVVAARARGGFIIAEGLNRVPPTRRLYSGGGGSIRGYRAQFVGELDANGDPVGGLSVGEVGLELRLRYGAFGFVPFVEAGIVGRGLFSDFSDPRYGAGLGLRYYSPIGPIRVDAAIPINKRGADDDYQLYFSIGQAF